MSSLALDLFADVARHPHGLAARILDDPGRLCGVRLFLFEVGDQDVSTLAGEGERDRPSDARVAACDDGLLALELAAASVGFFPVVWLGFHLLLQAGMLVHLALLRVLRLRVLLLRVLLPVLVFWHPDLPSVRPSHSFLAVMCPFS